MDNINYDDVFSYQHLYESYKKCCKGVRWKASTQAFIANAPVNVYRLYKMLKDRNYKSSGFYEFTVCERGKVREIKSVTFSERVVQKCLCDYALVPVLSNTLIYDNGACIKNKGYSFSIKRLDHHLRQHIDKYGTDGYVLLFDFKKYFDSIPHSSIEFILKKNIKDSEIVKLTMYFVGKLNRGLSLGSQVSQILAVSVPNYLDHYIKERLRIKQYGRYMDDGYLIHIDKGYLKYCLGEIKEECKILGIELNEQKTQIVKLSHGFTYIKVRYKFDNIKIVKLINKKSIPRERQKLKKLHGLGLDVNASFESWCGYARNFSAYRTIQTMEKWRDNVLVNQTKQHSS